jgi:hypothetical protein
LIPKSVRFFHLGIGSTQKMNPQYRHNSMQFSQIS